MLAVQLENIANERHFHLILHCFPSWFQDANIPNLLNHQNHKLSSYLADRIIFRLESLKVIQWTMIDASCCQKNARSQLPDRSFDPSEKFDIIVIIAVSVKGLTGNPSVTFRTHFQDPCCPSQCSPLHSSDITQYPYFSNAPIIFSSYFQVHIQPKQQRAPFQPPCSSHFPPQVLVFLSLFSFLIVHSSIDGDCHIHDYTAYSFLINYSNLFIMCCPFPLLFPHILQRALSMPSPMWYFT